MNGEIIINLALLDYEKILQAKIVKLKKKQMDFNEAEKALHIVRYLQEEVKSFVASIDPRIDDFYPQLTDDDCQRLRSIRSNGYDELTDEEKKIIEDDVLDRAVWFWEKIKSLDDEDLQFIIDAVSKRVQIVEAFEDARPQGVSFVTYGEEGYRYNVINPEEIIEVITPEEIIEKVLPEKRILNRLLEIQAEAAPPAGGRQGAEWVGVGGAKNNAAKGKVFLFFDKYINDPDSKFSVLKEGKGKGTQQDELIELYTLFVKENPSIEIKTDTFKKSYLNEWRRQK